MPDPKILNARDAIVEITSTAICGSDLHLYNGFVPTMETGDILGHEFMGEVVEVGPRREQPEGRRPGRRAVPDRLRRLLRLPAASCTRSARTPTRTPGWPRSCGATRRPGIFGYSHLLRRLRRRAGRVRPGAVRRRRAAQGAGRPDRRAGAVPLRHLPHRLHGRRDVRHQARRRRSPSGAAGRWASSPSPAPSCSAPSGSSPSTASRTGCGWRASKPAPRRSTTRRSTSTTALMEMTGGRGPDACIDAVGHGGARPGTALRLRPGQAGDDAGDGPAARAARGDHGLPQRRHRLGDRRLRRVHRQVPDGRR